MVEMSISTQIKERDDRIRALEGALKGLLILIGQNCGECGCQPSIIESAAEKARAVLENEAWR